MAEHEQCEVCSAPIPDDAAAHVYLNRVVCAQCYEGFTAAEKSVERAAARERGAPPYQLLTFSERALQVLAIVCAIAAFVALSVAAAVAKDIIPSDIDIALSATRARD